MDWRALAASFCPGALLLTRMPIIILARYLNARVFVDLPRKRANDCRVETLESSISSNSYNACRS